MKNNWNDCVANSSQVQDISDVVNDSKKVI